MDHIPPGPARPAAPTDTPYDLAAESGGDGFTVTSSRPELSWKLPSDARRQDGWEIQAVVGEQELTTGADSDRHRFVDWPWPDLRSGENVRWRVRTRHGDRLSPWSAWSAFECGLLEPDWSAEWISAPEPADLSVGERPAYAFSHIFTLDAPPGDARLYSAALGVYEAYVNGERAGAVELAPGTTSYDRTLYAQAADVTPLLRAGENTITFILSDGWFRGRNGAFRRPAGWGEQTAVRGELRLADGSGPRTVATTDRSWIVAESAVIRADLMDGQVTDLSRTPRILGSAVAGPADIPAVSWSPAPPVRVTAELQPLSVTALDPDTVIVDFGQNASGHVRLTSLGPAGARTELVHAEHLGTNGDVTLAHLDTPTPEGGTVAFRQHDEVISDGSPHAAFEPRHTVHGFRYVRVHRPGLGLLDPADISLRVVHTDFRPAGSFTCSDDDLNRLWTAADWSFRGNAVDIPTDCPTRERAGWTGDWQVFLPTAVRLYDVDGFSRKWLRSVRDDQLDDGRIANASPDPHRLRSVPDPSVDFATGSAGWGDAILLVPWELYRSYGDSRVLAENWEAMTRWTEFALAAAAGNRHPSRAERSADPQPHERHLWDGTFHFGEWLEPTPVAEDGSPGPTMPDPVAWAMADKGEVATAYLYHSVATLARIANTLGHDEHARTYETTAAEILAAWRTEFLKPSGHTTGDTQAGYVRALTFGLIPEELRPAAAQRLAGLVHEAGGHLATGFLSTADLLPVLADTGHPDVAHTLLLQRRTPSWLGMLDRGATTIWEEWEGVDRNGRAHASLNHYSKGAVIRYLHSHTLGLQQDDDSTAWETFTVAPVLPAHLDWAEGHFDGPQGRIDVRWEISTDEAVLRVTVPGGSRATLVWGEERVQAGPGGHVLRTKPEEARRPN